MRTITIAEAAKKLAILHKQVGPARFDAAKDAWLETVALTDELGDPVEKSALDIEIKTFVDDAEPAVAGGITEERIAEIAAKTVSAVLEKSSKAGGAGRMAGSFGDEIRVRSTGAPTLKNFKGDSRADACEKAYRFGTFLAATHGKSWAIAKCREIGIPLRSSKEADNGGWDMGRKAHSEAVNTSGGFWVPDEFSGTIIDLRNEYGVFRRYSRVLPMGREVMNITRRTGGLTMYYTAEAAAGTESTKSIDRVTLTARKGMVLTTYSNELAEDSIISVADDLAGEIAYAFAKGEDDAGFIGDATSTYGGITGVVQRLYDVNGSDDGGGIVNTTETSFAALTNAWVAKLVGILPTYARRNAKFFGNPAVLWQTLGRLQIAAGGTTLRETASGPEERYFGYPMVAVESMSASLSQTYPSILFGDLSLCSTFGDRRGVSVATSDSALNAFEQDEMAVRGTQRFDINVHDVGTATVAGPIVGLTFD